MTPIIKLLNIYPRLFAVLSVFVFALTLNTFISSQSAFVVIALFSTYIILVLGWGMIKTIKSRQYGVDLLAILAIVSTLLVGQYWATIVIVAMLVGGEALEDFANQRAKNELKKLLERAPKLAHLINKDGSISDVRVEAVKIDAELQVGPGELVPVDAKIISGASLVDESSITGESLPVAVIKGDIVLSGSINGEDTLIIKAIRSAENSQYSQIIKLVKAASDSNAPFIRLADRYAVPFTIISLIIAITAWILSSDPKRFAEVLVVATPCPLLIAAPVALISGMSRAARHGIIIKSGGVLERLSEIKTAVFDKTGTLTYSRLKIASVVSANKKISEKSVVSLAASAEQQSVHILAKAITEYAKSNKIKIKKASSVTESNGSGLIAQLGKDTVVVGRIEFLKKQNIKVKETSLFNHTSIYIAKNSVYMGAITFEDEVRENAKYTIDELKRLGIQNFVMLTGDKKETANKIGGQIGIVNIHAECLPTDKLNFMKSLKDRPVMMVGDGVNDAPVLAASDLGIAMGAHGETAASESADVVVMLDDISKVPQVVEISKRTMKIARQSIYIGIGASIVLMLIATTGRIPAIVGAGLQELIDIIVIANALRAHRGDIVAKLNQRLERYGANSTQ